MDVSMGYSKRQVLAALIKVISTKNTVVLYHGSHDQNLKEIKDNGLFGGVFAGSLSTARSHGDNIYKIELDWNDVCENRDLSSHADLVRQVFERETNLDKNDLNYKYDFDLLWEIVIRDKGCDGLYTFSEVEYPLESEDEYDVEKEAENIVCHLLDEGDLGDAGWKAQKIRGIIAKKLGYKAVECSDEHGISYLVLSGANIEPYDENEDDDL